MEDWQIIATRNGDYIVQSDIDRERGWGRVLVSSMKRVLTPMPLTAIIQSGDWEPTEGDATQLVAGCEVAALRLRGDELDASTHPGMPT